MAPAPENQRSAPPRPARPDSQREQVGEQRAPPAARSAPSGIIVDQASQEKVIPASVRADGSERRVKPGFTPAEDVLRFRSPRMMARKREEQAAKERVAGTPTKAAAAPAEQRKPTAAASAGDPVAQVQERMAALSVDKDGSPGAKGEQKEGTPAKPASRADERTEKASEPSRSDAQAKARAEGSDRSETCSNTGGSWRRAPAT